MRHRGRQGAAGILGVFLAGLLIPPAEAVGPLSGGLHIHGIAFDTNDDSRLFVATHEGLFLISPDGTGVGVSTDDDYVGFVVAANDPGLFLASGHSPGGESLGLLASRNAGRDWKVVSAGTTEQADFHALAVSAAAPDTIYGLDEGIRISRDGGKTWEVTGSPPSPTVDLAVSAIDPGIVYAATADGVYFSLDEGRIWRPTAGDRGAPATMVQTAPDGTIYAFIVGSGLIKTPAATIDWSPVARDIIDGAVTHLTVHPIDPDRIVAVTQHSRIVVSLDGGASWNLMAGRPGGGANRPPSDP